MAFSRVLSSNYRKGRGGGGGGTVSGRTVSKVEGAAIQASVRQIFSGYRKCTSVLEGSVCCGSIIIFEAFPLILTYIIRCVCTQDGGNRTLMKVRYRKTQGTQKSFRLAIVQCTLLCARKTWTCLYPPQSIPDTKFPQSTPSDANDLGQPRRNI